MAGFAIERQLSEMTSQLTAAALRRCVSVPGLIYFKLNSLEWICSQFQYWSVFCLGIVIGTQTCCSTKGLWFRSHTHTHTHTDRRTRTRTRTHTHTHTHERTRHLFGFKCTMLLSCKTAIADVSHSSCQSRTSWNANTFWWTQKWRLKKKKSHNKGCVLCVGSLTCSRSYSSIKWNVVLSIIHGCRWFVIKNGELPFSLVNKTLLFGHCLRWLGLNLDGVHGCRHAREAPYKKLVFIVYLWYIVTMHY